MKRRDFLLRASGAAGGTAVAAAAAPASAQETSTSNGTGTGSAGNGTAGNGTGNTTGGNQSANGTMGNATGNASGNASASGGGGGTETVTVGASGNGGNYAFGPEELTVAPGTTVTWEWNGKGGAHNVMSDDDGPLDSGAPEEGSDITYQHTFEETGEFPYHCVPHKSLGMVGSVIVQKGGASSGGGGGEEEVDPEDMGVPIQAHWVGAATLLMLMVSFVYTFFQLKYGESPNSKGGN